MKKLMFWVISACLALSSPAAWKGGDGRWNDPDMWTEGRVPTADDIATFSSSNGGRVEFDGDFTVNGVHLLDSASLLPDESPVVFTGSGSLTTSSFIIYKGRSLALSGVTVDITGTTAKVGDDNGPGRLEVLPGGVFDNTGGRTYVYAGSTLFMNGGYACGNLTVYDGGTFHMTSGTYRYTQKTDGINKYPASIIDVTGGTIVYGSEVRAGHTYIYENIEGPAFFPDRPGKTLVVDSRNSTAAAQAVRGNNVGLGGGRDEYCLAGTLVVTNVATDAASNGRLVSLTNTFIYGGGTLAANQFYIDRAATATTQHLALARIELGEGFVPYGNVISPVYLHGAVTLAGWDDWLTTGSKGYVEMCLAGALTLDTACSRASARGRTVELASVKVVSPGVKVNVTGTGRAGLELEAASVFPMQALTVDEASALVVSGRQSRHWVEDFTLLNEASLTIPFKCLESGSNVNISCISSSTIAPSAQITAVGDYASAANNEGVFYGIYAAAPGGQWPKSEQWTLQLNGTPENPEPWEMRVVGPAVYLRDGKIAPKTAYTHWTGAVNGLWSESGNWSDGKALANGASVWLALDRQGIVTNDLAACTLKGVRVDTSAGPFVVRGNPITISRGTGFGNSAAGVYHGGAFPLIFENQVSCTATDFYLANDGTSYIAFMCPNEVDLATKPLHMRGKIVFGCDAVIKTLDAQNDSSANDVDETLLALVNGANVTINNQTIAFTNKASLSIAGGSELAITGGEFRYADKFITHKVDGLLDIQVPFAPALEGLTSADVAFAGTGRVQFAEMAPSSLGPSRVEAFGGITLSPAGDWVTTLADTPDTYLALALPEWGKATIAPRADFVYGPAAGAAPATTAATRAFKCGRFSELTLNSPHAVSFADPLVCERTAKLIKSGAGTLTLTENDVLPDCIALNGGILRLTSPKVINSLTVEGAATLELTDGASLTLTGENLALDGLTLKLPPAANGWRRVLTVPVRRVFNGVPGIEDNQSLRFVTNADGSTSLEVKNQVGMVIILK